MSSLLELYKVIFPDDSADDPFQEIPILPADVFAFAATALDKSGAYHHVAPDIESLISSNYRNLIVTDTMRAEAAHLGKTWREKDFPAKQLLPKPPQKIDEVWQELRAYKDTEIFVTLHPNQPSPLWWSICLKLLMISDEASLDIGFNQENPFSRIVLNAYLFEDAIRSKTFRRIQHAPKSLSTASEDILCVQPKSRTPAVGCTLRSLSHHLALLPPRGSVKARWIEPPSANTFRTDETELGLLLVPYPYEIENESFSAIGVDRSEHWGWFDANQTWLPKGTQQISEFIEFIMSLIADSRDKGLPVNGVILPELSLNYEIFLKLGDRLAKDAKIDFLISGISSNKDDRRGNFVAIAPFFLFRLEQDYLLKSWEPLALIREKHHRWKLQKSQIQEYNLSLDEDKSWWENLTILSRSLDFLVYKGDTTLTTLICEDLARMDPCQAVIRAIGPNLLIALLMDGPQLIQRWPSRYATVLTEDPGSSVLTFTSMGLISRQNGIGKHPQASSIALWSDERNASKPIELPRNADGITLILHKQAKNERTLDGREDNNNSHAWIYKKHIPVKSADKPDWI
ncbi:hypothetical protein [uncultured Cohaesibacter sp.]|uniref:hypothetical protein n=1 Tax=uncultured Cohaesibacter sp. TaxID=1002546 RepID=UPI00292D3A31|nr:hypothetical protein [uncultured Cohaesibacter sp.]